MSFRLVKRKCWWTTVFDANAPKYLYYDYDLDHFEVASYGTAYKHKIMFSMAEITQMKKDYPDLLQEFLLDAVKRDKEE